MLVPVGEQSNKNNLILPAGVNLRECSVVIIGSTCQICGRNFKCITDVALHMQWRHHQLKNVLNDCTLNPDNRGDDHNNTENTRAEVREKCNVCDEHLTTTDEHDLTADLKSYKRQINKKQIHEKRRARKLRLIIKIAGVTMTEIRLSRKYLKVHSNEYFADVGTQTESQENEKRQDAYGMNIDLSLADRVVGNSRCVRPYKATNRYIEGLASKLASIQGDAIACSTTRVLARRPVEISNTPNEDAATIGANDPCASPILVARPRKIVPLQVHTTNSFVGSIVDTIDVPDETSSLPGRDEAASPISILEDHRDWYCRNRSPRQHLGERVVYQQVKSAGTTTIAVYDVPDETNSPRRNEGEGRNANPASKNISIMEDRDWYRRNHHFSRDHSKESVVHQRIKKSAETTATTSTATIPNSSCNKNPRHLVWSNKTTMNKTINKSSPPTEPIEIIIDNESDDNCDEDMTKCRPTRVDGHKQSATTAEPDDDVQEILRITRGKVQSDINHESPNRTEREMLVRNALGQMYVSSTQPAITYPEKDDTILVVNNNNNVETRDCPPYVTIVDDACPFPNVTTFMYKTYDDKLDVCLNKLHNYSMRYCNDPLPEINNNG